MKKVHFFVLLIAMFVLIVGCNKQPPTPKQTDNNQVEVEQSSYEPDQIMNTEQIANHLAKVASEVPDVHDATAVVAGPYAVVGIDVDEDVERQESGKIKYTVSEAMEHDPYGRSAVVIADADMFKRLKEMKNAIQSGSPVQGISDELGNIVSRYMPTFPIDDDGSTNDSNNEDLIEKEKGLK